ncbi:MAG: RNA polymerase sigma-70 factor, ECF subfamily [Rhodobacteraceae bacterium HLUCCA08]|nr:MAG: RNA polymerase sigma-70 factor, ECF subfamily [Rhodobacteraceae bacterium HLUCCA08]
MSAAPTCETRLARVALGDREAFVAMYRDSAPRLFAVLLHLLGNRAEAEATLPDLYVEIRARAAHRRPGRGGAEAWLVALAREIALERRHRRPAGPEDALPPSVCAPRLDACLRRLSPERAEALQRAWLWGETPDQLSRRVAMPPGALCARLRDDLTVLAACLHGAPENAQTARATAMAGACLLGLLPVDEAELAEDRIAIDADFARLVDRWRTDLAQMVGGLDPVPPPPEVLAALDLRLFADRDRPLWQRLGLVQAVLGAAAAAGILLLALELGLLNDSPGQPPDSTRPP